MKDLKVLNLTDEEATFLCDFGSHVEEHMPWFYDFFGIDKKSFADLFDRIYRITDTYAQVQAEEAEMDRQAV